MHAHFKVVDDWQQLFKQAGIGVANGILAFAGRAFAQVFHLSGGAQRDFLPLRGLIRLLLRSAGSFFPYSDIGFSFHSGIELCVSGNFFNGVLLFGIGISLHGGGYL